MLTTDGALNPDSDAIVGVSLAQGNVRRTLLPGYALADIFHPVENLPAIDYNWYQRQLTIGPNLRVKE